ncbi:MAG: Stp1/IreP family PP2C-type Ser/Thr phosphatase [Firmicutes bacterium]|nr:Stp1/IreP family PP2C-type Ser/Thr phosphatase [Bacillota bacterium]
MLAAGISDQGRVRPNNEDRYLILDESPLLLLAVADGMGGHAAGEVASSMALDVIRSYLDSHRQKLLQAAAQGKTLLPYLEKMLALANAQILQSSGENCEYNGMGTTLTMILHVLEMSWLAHIGDSRAYLFREQSVQQLTEDHTLVSQLVKNGQIRAEEASDHPQRNILTRALGTDKDPGFDIIPLSLRKGDRLLLCTDGLHSHVGAEEIAGIIAESSNREEAVKKLVNLANARGGTDNITVILAEKL